LTTKIVFDLWEDGKKRKWGEHAHQANCITKSRRLRVRLGQPRSYHSYEMEGKKEWGGKIKRKMEGKGWVWALSSEGGQASSLWEDMTASDWEGGYQT